eukprot:2631974-Prymnesium_polylepis.2
MGPKGVQGPKGVRDWYLCRSGSLPRDAEKPQLNARPRSWRILRTCEMPTKTVIKRSNHWVV